MRERGAETLATDTLNGEKNFGAPLFRRALRDRTLPAVPPMRRQPQNGNMDLNGVRSANGRHQIARPCGNDQLVQFIERPCRSNRLDRTGAREKPGARRLQTSRMQRENHRDRRPAYFIRFPIRSRKQLPHKYNAIAGLLQKVRRTNGLSRFDATTTNRKRTGKTPCGSIVQSSPPTNSATPTEPAKRFSVPTASPTRAAPRRESAAPTAFRRTSEQATRAFGFPPFVKSPRTAVLRRRKVSRRTHPRPKERLRPIAPGCASALKNFYSVRRFFSCRTVSPSGSGSTPRISETVCPRRAFEPAGTDWLKTVPTPENETIIPCRSSR